MSVSVSVSVQREGREDALFVGFEGELSTLFLQNGQLHDAGCACIESRQIYTLSNGVCVCV